MRRSFVSSISGAALALASMAVAAPAQARYVELPDQLALGRNSNGDPCTATRFDSNTGVASATSKKYSVTCRGGTANRFIGLVRGELLPSDLPVLEKALACGEASTVDVPGIGAAQARRCYDRQLGYETIETRFSRKKLTYSVSIVPFSQAPGEEALRMLIRAVDATKADPGRTVTAAIDQSKLAPSPMVESGAETAASDIRTALDQGISYLRQGLHSEAARGLNDALKRVTADTPVGLKIDLLLAAALANSNQKFFALADERFAEAEKLLAANPDLAEGAVLTRKLKNYRAQGLLNQRQFAEASTASTPDAAVAGDMTFPLMDLVQLRKLNMSAPLAGSSASAQLDAPDTSALEQFVIDAQSALTRSQSLLGQKRLAEAAAALQQADAAMEPLQDRSISQLQLYWLQARIERQRARLFLRTNRPQDALVALDKAIALLGKAGRTGSVGPTLADTQMERALISARAGKPVPDVLAQFEAGVNTLVAADAAAVAQPPALVAYLDLLVADAAQNPNGTSPERFFRAMQAVGDPSVARQFNELRAQITANPKLASKIKDGQDIGRAINQVAAQIAETTDPAQREELQKQSIRLENQQVALRNELSAFRGFNAVDNSPATIADVQKILGPGEAFLKINQTLDGVFGILIDASGAQIWRAKLPAKALMAFSDTILNSIIPKDTDTGLPVFRARAAGVLFENLAGPAADRLLSAKALIVDGSGPLEKLPIGVLVTDKASLADYDRTKAKAPKDFSRISFLALKMPISYALSPRSLLTARQAGASSAPYPFIGFAQHSPVPASFQAGDQTISVGGNCTVPLAAVFDGLNAFKPISAAELDRVEQALGVPGAPKVTGEAFTDLAVEQRSDLNQFQVLHFATHGLAQGDFGCDSAPPGLLTSYGGKGSIAFLTSADIAKLNLDANLVVLSACQTARAVTNDATSAQAGEGNTGAAATGLVRSVLAANARAVLATYWKIPDTEYTQQLMADFYRSARSGTIGAALRTAQTTLMTSPKYSHPFNWGAFFVVGDAQKSMITGTARASLGAPGTAPVGVPAKSPARR